MPSPQDQHEMTMREHITEAAEQLSKAYGVAPGTPERGEHVQLSIAHSTLALALNIVEKGERMTEVTRSMRGGAADADDRS